MEREEQRRLLMDVEVGAAEKVETHERFLWQGLNGEGIVAQKGQCMEKVALLAGFFVAFMIDNLLGLDPNGFHSEGLDPTSIQARLIFQFHAAFLTLATSSGIVCISILMYVGTKISRLIGRTQIYFGMDGDAEKSRKHGSRYLGSDRWDEHGLFKQYTAEPAMLFAYGWYSGRYDEWGKPLQEGTPRPDGVAGLGMSAFKVMVFAACGAVVTKLVAVLGYIIGACHSAVFVTGVLYAFRQLGRVGALDDLI